MRHGRIGIFKGSKGMLFGYRLFDIAMFIAQILGAAFWIWFIVFIVKKVKDM